MSLNAQKRSTSIYSPGQLTPTAENDRRINGNNNHHQHTNGVGQADDETTHLLSSTSSLVGVRLDPPAPPSPLLFKEESPSTPSRGERGGGGIGQKYRGPENLEEEGGLVVEEEEDDDSRSSSDSSDASSSFLDRQNTTLESLSAYVVVSCLTATASFGTIQQLGEPEDGAGADLWILHMIGLIVSALSTLAGMYSTVMFSLCAAYGYVSLGMGHDDNYDTFMKDTKKLRHKAFFAYLWSLGLFVFEIVLVTTERLSPPLLRYSFGVGLSSLAWLVIRDWKRLVSSASIFFTTTTTTKNKRNATTAMITTATSGDTNNNSNNTTRVLRHNNHQHNHHHSHRHHSEIFSINSGLGIRI